MFESSNVGLARRGEGQEREKQREERWNRVESCLVLEHQDGASRCDSVPTVSCPVLYTSLYKTFVHSLSSITIPFCFVSLYFQYWA